MIFVNISLRSCLAGLLFIVAVLSLSPGAALAHRVNLFAWLEGDNVIVQCGFNRSNPVRGGHITVYDSTDGRIVATGITNENGNYAFRVPTVVRQGHGLRIVVNAGEGHASEYAMNASEFYEAAALEAGFEQDNIAAGRLDAATARSRPESAAPRESAPSPATVGIVAEGGSPRTAMTADDVRSIVEKSLERHLAPIHRALGTDDGISIGDIFAGLGWIIGIVGIICYFRSRRSG